MLKNSEMQKRKILPFNGTVNRSTDGQNFSEKNVYRMYRFLKNRPRLLYHYKKSLTTTLQDKRDLIEILELKFSANIQLSLLYGFN